MQVVVEVPKKEKGGPKTKVISFRIPVFIEQQIDTLVELGLFKDRTDFLNYAIQKALFELVDKIVVSPSEEVIDLMLSLEPVSPVSDDEMKEVMRDVEREIKFKFSDSSSGRSERRRVLHIRRADSKSNESNNGD